MGGHEAGILIGRADDPKVTVLAYAKRALNSRRVRYRELMDLLDGIVFGIYRVLGDGAVWDTLDNGINR